MPMLFVEDTKGLFHPRSEIIIVDVVSQSIGESLSHQNLYNSETFFSSLCLETVT
jgi:hypothetical protein